MVDKAPPKKTRGRPVVLMPWWLEAANKAAQGMTTTELAMRLSAIVQRTPAWDRTTVSDFLKNESPTYELMEAFCIAFDLPPAVIEPRTYAEADWLRKEARRFDESNPEKSSRQRELDKVRELHAKRIADQTKQLDSIDDKGRLPRRRPRGMDRGGTSS
jgi:transcriptional regulator with XRE-family HTH domain